MALGALWSWMQAGKAGADYPTWTEPSVSENNKIILILVAGLLVFFLLKYKKVI
jgi:hypothetical protein